MATFTATMAESPREWTPAEVSLVETVATQMRTAVQMARVQQREHRIAQQLQGSLLPPILTNIDPLDVTVITRPALDDALVGGDYSTSFHSTKSAIQS